MLAGLKWLVDWSVAGLRVALTGGWVGVWVVLRCFLLRAALLLLGVSVCVCEEVDGGDAGVSMWSGGGHGRVFGWEGLVVVVVLLS